MSIDAAEAPTRRRRRLSWTAATGLALVTVGLAILGWLAWEFWGTNWVSHRTQARVITQIEQGWKRGQSSALVHEGPVGDPVGAGAIVRIPRFGAGYAVPGGEDQGTEEPEGSGPRVRVPAWRARRAHFRHLTGLPIGTPVLRQPETELSATSP